MECNTAASPSPSLSEALSHALGHASPSTTMSRVIQNLKFAFEQYLAKTTALRAQTQDAGGKDSPTNNAGSDKEDEAVENDHVDLWSTLLIAALEDLDNATGSSYEDADAFVTTENISLLINVLDYCNSAVHDSTSKVVAGVVADALECVCNILVNVMTTDLGRDVSVRVRSVFVATSSRLLSSLTNVIGGQCDNYCISMSLTSSACSALAVVLRLLNTSSYEVSDTKLLEAAVDAAVSALETSIDENSPNLASCACDALYQLTVTGPNQSIAEFMACGGIYVLVALLQQWSGNGPLGVLSSTCQVLVNVTKPWTRRRKTPSNNSSDSDTASLSTNVGNYERIAGDAEDELDGCAVFGRYGGIDLLIQLLSRTTKVNLNTRVRRRNKRYETQVHELVCNASWALFNLTLGHERNVTKAAECGGLQVLTAALNQWRYGPLHVADSVCAATEFVVGVKAINDARVDDVSALTSAVVELLAHWSRDWDHLESANVCVSALNILDTLLANAFVPACTAFCTFYGPRVLTQLIQTRSVWFHARPAADKATLIEHDELRVELMIMACKILVCTLTPALKHQSKIKRGSGNKRSSSSSDAAYTASLRVRRACTNFAAAAAVRCAITRAAAGLFSASTIENENNSNEDTALLSRRLLKHACLLFCALTSQANLRANLSRGWCFRRQSDAIQASLFPVLSLESISCHKESTVVAVCNALISCACAYNTNAQQFGADADVGSIVKLIGAWQIKPTSRGSTGHCAQFNVIEGLCLVLKHATTHSLLQKEAAGQSGAIEELVKCCYHSDSLVACKPLATLVANSKANAERLQRANGVEALLGVLTCPNALGNNKNQDVDIVSDACTCLRHYVAAFNESGAARLNEHGGIKKLVNVLRPDYYNKDGSNNTLTFASPAGMLSAAKLLYECCSVGRQCRDSFRSCKGTQVLLEFLMEACEVGVELQTATWMWKTLACVSADKLTLYDGRYLYLLKDYCAAKHCCDELVELACTVVHNTGPRA